MPVMCDSRFRDDGILVLKAGLYQPSPEPREVPFAAAGFLFAPGHAIVDCPFDPDLPELFHGEEILYSARHGPMVTVCMPLVTTCFFITTPVRVNQNTLTPGSLPGTLGNHAKLHQLLAGGLPGYRFGFGQTHTLQQY